MPANSQLCKIEKVRTEVGSSWTRKDAASEHHTRIWIKFKLLSHSKKITFEVNAVVLSQSSFLASYATRWSQWHEIPFNWTLLIHACNVWHPANITTAPSLCLKTNIMFLKKLSLCFLPCNTFAYSYPGTMKLMTRIVTNVSLTILCHKRSQQLPLMTP